MIDGAGFVEVNIKNGIGIEDPFVEIKDLFEGNRGNKSARFRKIADVGSQEEIHPVTFVDVPVNQAYLGNKGA